MSRRMPERMDKSVFHSRESCNGQHTSLLLNITRATGYSMQIGGRLLIAAGLLAGPRRAWTITGKGILILLCLITVSAVCFGIYNALLSVHPISQIAIYNALIPVLGVIFAALLHEELRPRYIIAVIMMAAGIHMANQK